MVFALFDQAIKYERLYRHRSAGLGGAATSNTFVGFQASGSDRLDERLMIQLVLVGVALGEVGDRPVEPVALTEVGGDGDGVAGSGVGPSQGPSADPA